MPRILIADDDPDVVLFLRSALETEGYDVEAAGDLGAAAERLGRGGVDLVILDMGLRGLEGSAPARRLREKAGQPVRVLILTGRDLRREQLRGALEGADGSLEKGCSLDSLLLTVQRLAKARR